MGQAAAPVPGDVFRAGHIFFAPSGALQTFGLHEAAPGSKDQPPVWLQKMAQVHKKQNLQLHPKRPGPAGQPERRPEKAPEQQSSNVPLKCFVAALSIGLVITSVLGVYMAFKFGRDKRQVWGLLAAGTVTPLLLLFT